MNTQKPSSPANWPVGWTVHHVAETGSTNDDLFAAARAGAAHRTVMVADYQTAGRGRVDRRWDAQRGANLLVSLLFRIRQHSAVDDANASDAAARYTQLVALACREACTTLAGITPTLKWPNDLLIENQKLAGLLAVASPAERFVVVGIGVNVGWAPEGAVALHHVASARVTPHELLTDMLRNIDQLVNESVPQTHARYVSALGTLGKRVRVDLLSGARIEGDAFDVDATARLLVRDDGGVVHTIDVGDVMHLRTT